MFGFTVMVYASYMVPIVVEFVFGYYLNDRYKFSISLIVNLLLMAFVACVEAYNSICFQ